MKDKKTLLILIPFLLFVLIVGALAILGDRIPDNPPETIGNTAGNLNNSGYFCEYDGTVYFANAYDSNTLYSMDPSEQNIKKLGNASVKNILAGGKYLYPGLLDHVLHSGCRGSGRQMGNRKHA